VGVKGLAVGVSDEGGAIVDFGGAGFGRLEILGLGTEGEPAAEVGTVGGRIEAEEIGRAIAEGIAGRHDGGEDEERARGAGDLDADVYDAGKYAGVNFGSPDRAVTFGQRSGGNMRVAVDDDARTRGGRDVESGGIVAVCPKLGGRDGGVQDGGWMYGVYGYRGEGQDGEGYGARGHCRYSSFGFTAETQRTQRKA
jgi:hypothetical protein